MAASADISGFMRGLGEGQKKALAAARVGVNKMAAAVIGRSQALAPVKTGALKGSGTQTPAEMHGTSITAEVGHNVDYAAAVHERLDAKHPQGQAKFLETAMNEKAPRFVEIVGAEVKKVL